MDRQYFYNVFLVLAEPYVIRLVEDVKQQRKTRKLGGVEVPRQIVVTDEWLNLLMAGDFESCKYDSNSNIIPYSQQSQKPKLDDRQSC